MAADLFDSIQLGDLMLANRMVMAPMTRNRADASGVATPMMATHYQQRAQMAIVNGSADLVAFGIPFLANPDLVRRHQEGLPLNEVDTDTFYGGDERGYNDYPVYGQEQVV